jgi:hypothetical protein
MTTIVRTTLCLTALAWVSPAVAQVRDFNAAADTYGRGVHAYFAGRATEAEELFSLALADGPSDPRILYFRAMTLLRLGRSDDARGDMMLGAELEARQRNRYAVGTALARVQGSDRLLLERFRQQARTRASAVKGPALDQPTDAAAGVLRSRVIIPLDELMRPGGPQPLTAEEIARRAAAIEAGRAAAAMAPAEATAPPTTEPFGTGSEASPPAIAEPVTPSEERESSESPAADTTFEETPPAETPPAEEASDDRAADSVEDPFGGLE